MTLRYPVVSLLAAALAAALSACGGGGSSSDSTAAVNPVTPTSPTTPTNPVTPPAASGDTGSVSAQFAANGSGRYLLMTVGSQSTGVLTSVVQGAGGALTEIAGTTFAGASAISPAITREIGGDASFAQGRWFTGTITRAGVATVLSGNNASAHYGVWNTPASLPASGTLQCGAGVFTAPSYTGGSVIGQDAYFGTASGSATLSFGSAGAALAMTIDASAGNSSGRITGSGTLAAPANNAISGGFLGGSSGMLLALGDGGAGRYLVTGGYKVVLANGANYQGVATFRCS